MILNRDALARRLQPYLVNVPPNVRGALITAGVAEVLQEGRFGQQFVVFTNADLYDEDTGLRWGDPTFRNAETLIS